MLKTDNNKKYIVFPSWLQPTYKWDDLPEILSNPFKYDDSSKAYRLLGRIEEQWEYLRKCGYPERPQDFELLDGPVGGGIIVVDISQNKRWLGYHALTFDKGVDVTSANMMLDGGDWYVKNNVGYLEDTTDPGYWLATGKRRRDFDIAACAEHIESMSDSIIWLVRYERSKTNKEIRGLEDIAKWAKHFGLEVKRIDRLPEYVKDSELALWCKNSRFQSAFFEVSGGGEKFGFHFAVMLYIGLHLRYVAGRRMSSMFLLAAIEGKPKPYFPRLTHSVGANS